MAGLRAASSTVRSLERGPIPLSAVLRWPGAAAWPGPPPFTLGNLTEVLTAGNPLALMMRVQFLLIGGGSVGDLLWDTLPGWAAFHLTDESASGSVGSLTGYFTNVLWQGVVSPTGPPSPAIPDLGVHTVALID